MLRVKAAQMYIIFNADYKLCVRTLAQCGEMRMSPIIISIDTPICPAFRVGHLQE